jgi:hypothetical protein
VRVTNGVPIAAQHRKLPCLQFDAESLGQEKCPNESERLVEAGECQCTGCQKYSDFDGGSEFFTNSACAESTQKSQQPYVRSATGRTASEGKDPPSYKSRVPAHEHLKDLPPQETETVSVAAKRHEHNWDRRAPGKVEYQLTGEVYAGLRARREEG